MIFLWKRDRKDSLEFSILLYMFLSGWVEALRRMTNVWEAKSNVGITLICFGVFMLSMYLIKRKKA